MIAYALYDGQDITMLPEHHYDGQSLHYDGQMHRYDCQSITMMVRASLSWPEHRYDG